MHVSPASFAASAKPAKDAKTQDVGAVRSTVADGLRGVGAGYAEATDWNAVAVDKAMIHPIETVYAVGRGYKMATRNIPVVNKGSMLFTGAGFLTSFQSLISQGLFRAPGSFLKDVTHSIADRIDGGSTYDGGMGGFLTGAAAPDQSIMGADSLTG